MRPLLHWNGAFLLLVLLAASAIAAQGNSSAIQPSTFDDAAFFNELHYDNIGADASEGFEIVAPAGTNLLGWRVLLYNGADGALYAEIDLSGVVPDLEAGVGVLWFAHEGLQNGSPDGIALVDPAGNLVQFLSYEGIFTAADGSAASISSTDIGVSEDSATPLGHSLQLVGDWCADAFGWTLPAPASPGAINAGQSMDCSSTATPTASSTVSAPTTGPTQPIILNELLADPPLDLTGDANGDGEVHASQDEFVELINRSQHDIDLRGWSISDSNSMRHIFEESILLPAGCPLLIFGGGSPASIPGAVVATASTGSLQLNNSSDRVTVSDPGGSPIASYTYGAEANQDGSITRDPDVIGDEPLIHHRSVSTSPFSPGRKTNLSYFDGCSAVDSGVSPTPSPSPSALAPPSATRPAMPSPTATSTPTGQATPSTVEATDQPATPAASATGTPTEKATATVPTPTITPGTINTTTPSPTATIPVPPPQLVISEIMYDPSGEEPAWEWIEVVNSGDSPQSLEGFVLDDGNSVALQAPNVGEGLIQPGKAAVLYNADALNPAVFAAAWSAEVTVIPVRGWSALALNNDGDRIGLWQSFSSYQDDHESHIQALISLDYENGGTWPTPNNSASIFLANLESDPRVGAHWELSTSGKESPIGTAFENAYGSVGSPSGAAAPPPTATATSPPAATVPPTESTRGTPSPQRSATSTPTPHPTVQGTSLLITEIMYDPGGNEPHWEWIEVFNTGAADLDLRGFVLDDNNSLSLSSSNISDGTVPAGKSAILFNADAISKERYAAAWGDAVRLVEVSHWSQLSLNNGGDRIGLWDSFTTYQNDHQSHTGALISIAFQNGGTWPNANNLASIHLRDLQADPHLGASWIRSEIGASSPTGFAYRSADGDIGSPDSERPMPTSTPLPVVSPTETPSPDATSTPPTQTPAPTLPTMTPSHTATPTATSTATATQRPFPSSSPSATATVHRSSPTPSATATAPLPPTPSASPTVSPSPGSQLSPTATPARLEPPVVQNDLIQTHEDLAVEFEPLTNDYDPSGGSLTLADWTQPRHGQLYTSAGGVLRYQPVPDFSGTDEFRYLATGTEGRAGLGQVTIQVHPLNDAPIANDDVVVVAPGAAASVALLLNDYDADGDPLLLHSLGTYPGLAVHLNAGGVVAIPPGAPLSASIPYTVSDDHGALASAMLHIISGPQTEAPERLPLTDDQLVAFINHPILFNPLANDFPDVAPIDHLTLTAPQRGNARIVGHQILYTPRVPGLDEFAYKVVSNGRTGHATVKIEVWSRNTPPIAVTDHITVQSGASVPVAPLSNDWDPDEGTALSLVRVFAPARGKIAHGQDNSLIYTPGQGFMGRDRIVYAASDADGGLDYAEIVVEVTPVERPPKATDDRATIKEDTSLRIPVLANDSDPAGDGLELTAVGAASLGTVTIEGANLAYTPTLNVHGTDRFLYWASNGKQQAPAIVHIEIEEVPDRPLLMPDALIAHESARASFTLSPLENDYSPDGTELSLVWVESSGSGTVGFTGSNGLSYLPPHEVRATDRIRYAAAPISRPDLIAESEILIFFASADAALQLLPDHARVEADSPSKLDPLRNDNAQLALRIISAQAQRGTVLLDRESGLWYLPPPRFIGTDQVRYVAGFGDFAAESLIDISVSDRQRSPIARPDRFQTYEETSLLISPLENDAAVDTPLWLHAVETPGNGAIEDISPTTAIYRPRPNFSGTDRFLYTATDGTTQIQSLITIEVIPVNDPPDSLRLPLVTRENRPLRFRLLEHLNDPDGDVLTVAHIEQPQNGQILFEGDNIEYIPGADFRGRETVAITVTDENGARRRGSLLFHVLPQNRPPRLHPVAPLNHRAGETISVPFAASDADGDKLVFQAAGLPPSLGLDAASGLLAGRLRLEDVGEYTIVVKVHDGEKSDHITTPLHVHPANAGPPPAALFLPLLAVQPDRPDIVASLRIEPDKIEYAETEPIAITIQVANQGTSASGPFWVDLLVEPQPQPTAPPAVWSQHCHLDPCIGLAWSIPSLAPGQSLLLTDADAEPSQSIWMGRWVLGVTRLLLVADSWGGANGQVLEISERNNTVLRVGLSVIEETRSTAGERTTPPKTVRDLPPRAHQ